MTVGASIRRLREHNDMTQEELGKIANVSAMAVSQWENDRAVPRMGAIQALADHFGISKGELLDDATPRLTHTLKAKPQGMTSVPLVCTVHAGKPIDPDMKDGETADIPSFLLDSDPDTYACVVEGDCMDRVYPEGCIIAVSPNRQPSNGSIAVVSIDGHDAVMRRMYRTKFTLVLSPDSFNPEHEDIVITAESEHTVEFGGKVVWFQARREME